METSDQKPEVLRFISQFTRGGRRDQVIECFTTGCCYWFAHILVYRFMYESPMPELMHTVVDNHFGTKIGGRIYDITGDVTDQYEWEPWSNMLHEPGRRARIERDCINFGAIYKDEEE